MRENVPAAMAWLTACFTHFMYADALEAPAQSHLAAMLARMSAIAAGFWQRPVVQSSAAARAVAGAPATAKAATIASTRILARFICTPFFGPHRPAVLRALPHWSRDRKAGVCPIGHAGCPFGGSRCPFGGARVYGRDRDMVADDQRQQEGPFMRRPPEDKAIVPFPTHAVSNMEWVAHGLTRQQQLAERLIAEECAERARRHGRARAQFLRTAAASATAFMVLNRINGSNAFAVKEVHWDDLDAAGGLL